jgi:hypothetical protein
MFSRNTLSGKYLEINFNLVRDLKRLGLWERCKSEILANYGDLTHIEGIPEHLKEVYKTSFSIAPQAFIEVAARAQKWIDQAISRNMYLETRDTEEIMKVYITAWEKGLKTTYYLHMKPRHSAEQSTVKVNKASSIGKRGFGVLFNQLATEPASLEIPVTAETPAPVAFSMPTPEPVHVIPEINTSFSSVTDQPSEITQSFSVFPSTSKITASRIVLAPPQRRASNQQQRRDNPQRPRFSRGLSCGIDRMQHWPQPAWFLCSG